MFSIVSASVFAITCMVGLIVPKVATLAERGQVIQPVIAFLMIQVRDSQDYFATSVGVRLVVFCSTVLTLI